MYAVNDDNEIDKMADTEEKRAFDARFLQVQECKERWTIPRRRTNGRQVLKRKYT